ncbi:MAG: electron transport complex subunit RsxC [Proteobacteria bacterium]|nr:electron transport complex subunit RsxC [Pseudomonadota bacterium]
MSILTFRGGIHPRYNKERTAALATKPLAAPDELVLPLSQHIGAPAVATVSVGDTVLRGQTIAQPGGFVSAAIHAPVSGTVSAIEPRPTGNGTLGDAIVLANDHQDTETSYSGLGEDWAQADAATLRDMVARAGIVGLGGAAFPSHVKLAPPPDRTIDTVIINGAECEPWLTADHRLMLESATAVVSGLRIIQHILGAPNGVIGIEANKPDALRAISQAATGTPIRVVSLAVKYPQGGEKQLISACLKRRVPQGKLPMDVGVVVHNTGTAAAIHRAVVDGRPLLERIVTVTGTAVSQPANYWVRLGTPVAHVLQHCQTELTPAGKLILGGPMMGIAQKHADIPVVKSTSGILVLQPKDATTRPASPCIRCGRCVDACPMFLVPQELGAFARLRMIPEARAAAALDCMECGSCAHACPAHIPLVQLIRLAKADIHAAARKKM